MSRNLQSNTDTQEVVTGLFPSIHRTRKTLIALLISFGNRLEEKRHTMKSDNNILEMKINTAAVTPPLFFLRSIFKHILRHCDWLNANLSRTASCIHKKYYVVFQHSLERGPQNECR